MLSEPADPDPFNRPPITAPIKDAIRDAFAAVPAGKSSAVMALFDEHGARLHIAWRIDDTWQVGAVVGIPLHSQPYGSVFVQAAW